MPNPEIVVVERLVKRYGARLAVNAVSFAIRAGEVIGLPGPNGLDLARVRNRAPMVAKRVADVTGGEPSHDLLALSEGKRAGMPLAID